MHEKVILDHRDGSAHLKGAGPKPGFQPPPPNRVKGESVAVSFTLTSDYLQASWLASLPSPMNKCKKEEVVVNFK